MNDSVLSVLWSSYRAWNPSLLKKDYSINWDIYDSIRSSSRDCERDFKNGEPDLPTLQSDEPGDFNIVNLEQ